VSDEELLEALWAARAGHNRTFVWKGQQLELPRGVTTGGIVGAEIALKAGSGRSEVARLIAKVCRDAQGGAQ
jgi:hypothetical protein